VLITGTNNMPEGVKEFYDKLHLAIAMPKLLFSLWAQKRPLKSQSGETIKFRRYGKLPKNKTPISEGVTPVGKRLSATDLTASVDQYGDWIALSDRVILTQPDPQIKDAVEILSIQESETMDELMRDVLLSGNSVYYANAVSGRSSVALGVSADDLSNIERLLDRSNAMKITKMINASTGYGTAAVDDCFIILTHTDCKKDYRGLNDFVEVKDYASTSKLLPGEFGSIGSFRCCATSEAKIYYGGGSVGSSNYQNDGSNFDVYVDVIIAQESYGDIPLNGASSGVIIKAHNKGDTSDTSDPLNQRNTAGKLFQVSAIAA